MKLSLRRLKKTGHTFKIVFLKIPMKVNKSTRQEKIINDIMTITIKSLVRLKMFLTYLFNN
jgi:hypothetical protein